MPIYTYLCKDCNKKFDLLILKSSDPIVCPNCNSSNLEKLISGFSILGSKDSSLEGSDSGSKCSSCSGGSCATCGG